MLLNRLLLLFLSIVSFAWTNAQTVNVQFRIVNTKNEVVPFATIVVIPVADTTTKIEKVSDSIGHVLLELQQGQVYLFLVSSVNYKPFEKIITVKKENEVFPFSLQPVPHRLNTV